MGLTSKNEARLSRYFYLWQFASRVHACIFSFFLTFAFILLYALACSVFLVPPASAYASPRYSVEELTTNIDVNPNASLNVEFLQLINFEDKNEGLCWYLGIPSNDASFKILNVRVAPVDEDGAFTEGWTRLQMYDVNKNLQGVNPGDAASATLRQEGQQPWYSYSIADGMIRCWFPAGPGRYLLKVDYTIYNGVNVYRDVAELNWRYAHASYPVEMNDITLNINLPAPSGEDVVPYNNVYAWGHGPIDGYFEVREDGSIIYHIDSLSTGLHADAHVMFPASWMNDMYKYSPRLFTETYKAEILQEESAWVDVYTRQQNWDFNVRIFFLSIAALLLLIGVIGVIRFGQTYRSRRLLTRIAVILLCVGLSVGLFFWEPMSEWMLLGIAAIVGIVSLFFPKQESVAEGVPTEEALTEGVPTEETSREELSTDELSDEEPFDEGLPTTESQDEEAPTQESQDKETSTGESQDKETSTGKSQDEETPTEESQGEGERE